MAQFYLLPFPSSAGHTPRNLPFFLTNFSGLFPTYRHSERDNSPPRAFSHGSNRRNHFDFRTISKPKEFASKTWLGSFDLYLNASIPKPYNTKTRRFVKNVYAFPETWMDRRYYLYNTTKTYIADEKILTSALWKKDVYNFWTEHCYYIWIKFE